MRGLRAARCRGAHAIAAAVALAAMAAALLGTSPANASLYWSAPTPFAPSALHSLSCSSATLCVGVDAHGEILTSQTPNVASAWTTAASPSPSTLSAVSCTPQGTLCAAVGEAGIYVSTNPTAGAETWRHVAESPPARTISCPGPELCVASGAGGRAIFNSIEPANASAPWKEASVEGPGPVAVGSLSCPSKSLCVAINEPVEGGVITSTDPAGGSGAWTTGQIGHGGLSEVSCPGADLCVAVGEETLASSANPAGGAASWKINYPVPALRGLRTLACASAALCAAAGDLNGYVASSSAPTDPASWERVEGVDGTNRLSAVACPSEAMCFAADDALVIGLAAHHLTAATQGSGEGEVRSGPLGCPFGCTYSGPICPRNCTGDPRLPNALIPQRLSEIVCGDGEFANGAEWTSAFCSQLYPAQDAPELSAVARPGSVFSGWSGDCTGRGACAPPMSSDRSVTALFEPKLSLSEATQLHHTWRERAGDPRAPVGTAFRFVLNRPATIKLRFARLIRGRLVGGSCRPLVLSAHRLLPRARHVHIRHCRRHVPAGTLDVSEPAGRLSLPFKGTVVRPGGRHGRLPAGLYAVKLSAETGGESSETSSLTFSVVG